MKHVIHETEVESVKLTGRDHKMIIGPGLTIHSEHMSFGVAFFPPVSHAPAHVHDNAEEIIYFLTGTGEMFFDGIPEKVGAGSCVIVPENVVHSIKNEGNETMKLAYVFSPPVKQGSYENKK